MSPPYRIEREMMARGQEVPTFRVIVKLGRGWGTVQAGLDQTSADTLCATLLANEAAKRPERILYRGGYRR